MSGVGIPSADVFDLWLAYRCVPMCEQCGHYLTDKLYTG